LTNHGILCAGHKKDAEDFRKMRRVSGRWVHYAGVSHAGDLAALGTLCCVSITMHNYGHTLKKRTDCFLIRLEHLKYFKVSFPLCKLLSLSSSSSSGYSGTSRKIMTSAQHSNHFGWLLIAAGKGAQSIFISLKYGTILHRNS